MSDDNSAPKDVIYSRFWEEEAEPDNPFAAKACYCHGYDVYSDILPKAGWVEYLYLMFKGERPNTTQAQLLEKLAIALANPGPRDYSVRAAMNGGVGGSTSAASLMAAMATGSGNLLGAHEVYVMMEYWEACGLDLDKWQAQINNPPQEERIDIWVPMEHPPGFEAHGVNCRTPVLQTLECLAHLSSGTALTWLVENRPALEKIAKAPLAMSGVAATTFVDLELTTEQAEMLYLILRLPGAAVHALEQRVNGLKKYPFFRDGLEILEYPQK